MSKAKKPRKDTEQKAGMNPEAMSKALDAIPNVALKLLSYKDRAEVDRGLRLIISLARYKHDVRSAADKKEFKGEREP